MSDERLFSELTLNGKPLSKCELALECNETYYRLYVDKEPKENIFYSLAVEFVNCSADFEDGWACPDLTVSPLFNTTAYFDGVRHLEFNRESKDMAGYIYYPNMQGLLALFSKVREIELEICRDCDEEI